MRVRNSIYLSVLLLAACTGNRGREASKLKKDIRGAAYSLQAAVVVKRKGGDKPEGDVLFQTRLQMTRDQLEAIKGRMVGLHYNLDSAFFLVSQKDTSYPNYVLPVANGQPLAPQYLVSFDREVLKGPGSVELVSDFSRADLLGPLSVSFDKSKIYTLLY